MDEDVELTVEPFVEDVQEDNVENNISVSETVIDYSESIRQFNNNCVILGCALLLVIGIVSGILLGRLFNGIFRD